MEQQDIQQEMEKITRRGSQEKAAPIDAISFLKSQHREVEELFEKIESSGERATKTKERLFEDIAQKLTAHTKIEETIFYPAAREADHNLVKEAFEEHDNVKAMLRKIKRVGGSDDTFDAKMSVLKELVKHHVKEEEEALFPKCEQSLGEDALMELGKKMQTKYQSLESSH